MAARKKISQLPAAGAFADAHLLAVVQGPTTVKGTLAQIRSFVGVNYVDIGALAGCRTQINSSATDGDPDPDYVSDHWLRSFVCPVDIVVAKLGFFAIPPGVSSNAWHPYETENGGGSAGGSLPDWPNSGSAVTECRAQLLTRARSQLAITGITEVVDGWNEVAFVAPVALAKGTQYRLRFAARGAVDIAGCRSDSGAYSSELSARIAQQRAAGVLVWSDFPALLEPGEVADPAAGSLTLSAIYNVDPYFRLIAA